MITGNVPEHLNVAARTGFLGVVESTAAAPYADIARVVDMDARSIDLVDLGAAPMPTRNIGRAQIADFIEKKMTVTPLDWDITVFISHNAVKDDKTDELDRKVRSAGENFNLHIANQAFKALNGGDGTTFGNAWDGTTFFSNSHVYPGAQYVTAQDNLYGLALSLDNFETVRVAARRFKQDQGEEIGLNYDLLVVPPELERIGGQITANPQAYDTANREVNPYAGNTRLLVNPQLDSTAWVLVASGISQKPVLIAMRERPNLQASWFDPQAADGGRYYFKFYARYNHFYGPWETAIMGNT